MRNVPSTDGEKASHAKAEGTRGDSGSLPPPHLPPALWASFNLLAVSQFSLYSVSPLPLLHKFKCILSGQMEHWIREHCKQLK